MLRSEDAHKRLESFQIENRHRKLVAGVKGLAKQPALIARAILDVNEKGRPFDDWQARNKLHEQASREVPSLTASERQQLCRLLFPKLASQVEAAWQLFDHLPYQVGYSRRLFRASGDAAAYASTRYNWLSSLHSTLGNYDEDIAWVAAWAVHIGRVWQTDCLGVLLGAALSAGGKVGEEVFDILKQSATNEHEIGGMGRHVTRAMLVSSRPEAWTFVEKLLLAAQRQEGLRQVILEAIDEAHPEAFERMLKMILEHRLLRFFSTVRAMDVWFGLGWEALTPAVLRNTVEQIVHLFNDEAARKDALKSATGETFYFALWCVAYHDAHAAIPFAVAARKDANLERRFVAAHFLTMLQIDAARAELVPFLEDEDLRIVMKVLNQCPDEPKYFDTYVRLLERMPEKAKTLEPIIWPWTGTVVRAHSVADKLVGCVGQKPATDLLPYMAKMSGYGKRNTIEKLCEMKRWDAATRDTMLAMLADRDSYVRAQAREALENSTLEEHEVQKIEACSRCYPSRRRRRYSTAPIGCLPRRNSHRALADWSCCACSTTTVKARCWPSAARAWPTIADDSTH
jgi:hypothetical protein